MQSIEAVESPTMEAASSEWRSTSGQNANERLDFPISRFRIKLIPQNWKEWSPKIGALLFKRIQPEFSPQEFQLREQILNRMLSAFTALEAGGTRKFEREYRFLLRTVP